MLYDAMLHDKYYLKLIVLILIEDLLVRGLASFNGKNKKVISMDETYLGMIFRPMGSCGKNFSSLGVVVTLRPEAYFFGGYHIVKQ